MSIKVSIAVQHGSRTQAEILEFEELGPEELAQIENLCHETLAICQRVAAVRQAKAEKGARGG